MLVLVLMLVPIVVQSDAIEFLEWIDELAGGSGKATVERNAFWKPNTARTTNVDALALLDVSKIDSVDATSLVWDHRGLHVADQSPLCRPEEGVAFDI